MNNASHRTLNDYFSLGLYKGEIYKSTNMLNRTLMQYCPDEDSLFKEQKRIEESLNAFKEGIWTGDTLQNPSSRAKKSAKSKKCVSPTSKKFSSSKISKRKDIGSSSSGGVSHTVRKER